MGTACRFQMTQLGRLHRDGRRGAYAIIHRGTIGKPVIHSEDLATDLVWIDILRYGLDNAGKFVAWNRAGCPSALWCMGRRIPLQFRRRHPRRMDADEHFAAARLWHRSRAGDQGGSVEGIVKAHDIHRFHCESKILRRSLRRSVRTLLGDGAPHHEHDCDKRDREHGKHEEGVEIGERGGLLLAQVLE